MILEKAEALKRGGSSAAFSERAFEVLASFRSKFDSFPRVVVGVSLPDILL